MVFNKQLDKNSRRLVKYGFIKKHAQEKYIYDHKKGYFVNAETKGEDYHPKDADEEFFEKFNVLPPSMGFAPEYHPSGYPKPCKTYRIIHESMKTSMEHNYFWIMDHCRTTIGFTRSWKVFDVFTATENSAFFGNSQQRLGLQQDKVQQYLATIGKMVKDLFQLVRELRVIDEKMTPRTEWHDSKAADSTLKGEFIDLVENRGGQMNASSVYGLAQNLGYATLPDLFFNTHVTKLDEIDSFIAKLAYNENIKNVLKRKLYQYINWKLRTDHELTSRRTFTLKYLRQHWDVIQMYMNWIKPYLQHIRRLHMDEEKLDRSIDLIGAFEQSFIEIEVIFGVPNSKYKPAKPVFDVAIMNFQYRTRPQMSYQQEGYNRGPLHMGQFEFIMRAYTMSEETIKRYINMRKEESFELLSTIDESVKSAMDALGEELQKYLKEAGEEKFIPKDLGDSKKKDYEKAKKAVSNPFEPFTSLFSGFSSLIKTNKSKEAISYTDYDSSMKGFGVGAAKAMWQVYKNFKGHMGWYKWS